MRGGVEKTGMYGPHLIESVFNGRKDYVIIRMSKTFPDFLVPSDVDILCLDKDEFSRHILKQIKGIKSRTHKKLNHLQVDLFKENSLYFKFDLIDSLSGYNLDEKKVFESKCEAIRKGKKYWVPSTPDEMVIRLTEFMRFPKKTWHLDYIKQNGAPGLFLDLASWVSI